MATLDYEKYKELHKLWFNEGKVSIDLLSDWRDSRKTELLHYFVETKIPRDFKDFFDSEPIMCSIGKFPEYDIELKNSNKIEIKISSFEGNQVFIETGKLIQGIWEPSGLSLSTSDYYLFLQPGKVQKKGEITMKVRVIPTLRLKELGSILKSREFNNQKGFDLDFITLENDGWLGSYAYDQGNKIIDLMSPTKAFQHIKALKA